MYDDLFVPYIGLLLLACFAAAALYAAVGHGGASAYLLILAWSGMSWSEAKPLALGLNVIVSLFATIAWGQRESFPWRIFLPLIAGSVPAVYLSSRLPMNDHWFQVGIACALLAAAVRLWCGMLDHAVQRRQAPGLLLFGVGAVIGLFSGWLGIGGGVFLTPLLLLAGFANLSLAALLSAAFILVNSSIGLAGWFHSDKAMPPIFWCLAPIVLMGGWIGARWGSRRACGQTLRRCLSGMLLIAVVKMIWLS